MSLKNIISFLVLFLVLTVSYSNCSQVGQIDVQSQKVDDTSLSAPQQQVDTPNPNTVVVPGTPNSVDGVITNCQKAFETGKLQTVQRIINFEDSRVETQKAEICEFANPGQITTSGNLETRDGYLQARYEQNRNLNLPKGAVLCDIQMQNDLQSFRYDDVFFFSFNGYLLATNDKTAVKMKLTPSSMKVQNNQFTDFYRYDWSLLRTAPFQNVADDYCLGSEEGLSSCAWPISEKQGQIKFSFAQPLLISISANVPAENQQFSFAITGDNDRSIDCYHEKLEFTMNVKYFIP